MSENKRHRILMNAQLFSDANGYTGKRILYIDIGGPDVVEIVAYNSSTTGLTFELNTFNTEYPW